MTNAFAEFDFADNPDPRCPVVLVLDASSSMGDTIDGVRPIDALNDGLDVLVRELNNDALARRRVELAVVTFGTEANLAADFATVDHLVLPMLEPSGTTSMGAAINVALDALEARKASYKANGIAYYRPWILLITDGMPTDDITAAAARVKASEVNKQVAFFAVGIEGADFERLATIGTRAPLKLKGLAFDQLFVWLSASQSRVSASNPGDTVPLPTPDGWAQV